MIEHRSLQRTHAAGPPSARAAELAAAILDGQISLDVAFARTAEHLMTYPRVEVVALALTSFVPADEEGWVRLGSRAWLRQWTRPGSTCSILPGGRRGPEAALSMPWLSQFARTGTVVLVDRELLPPEAAQDRAELSSVGVRSNIAATLGSGGEMFGSLSAGGASAGPWDEQVISDFGLLNAAITSRLTVEHSRRALADAIEASTEAQLAYQQFFAAVGHELRTPLAAIMGYTEVLLDDAAQAPQEPVAAALLRDGPVILRAVEQVVSVVDSLLGAGRTLSGDDKRQAVVIADAVDDVVHWHRTPAEAAGVELQVVVDPDAIAWAHPSGVRQVLANLVGNAISHHRPAGGTVRLTTDRLVGESGREMVRVVVRDNGPGLTRDQLHRVFEPFVRFGDASSKGSGLGLSISRTVAERDGGAVQGESSPGIGSSFWLEVPALRGPGS